MLVYMLTFGDIWGILMVNVTIYNIHGSYGGLINHGLLIRGGSPNSHDLILFYGTFPIKQPFVGFINPGLSRDGSSPSRGAAETAEP